MKEHDTFAENILCFVVFSQKARVKMTGVKLWRRSLDNWRNTRCVEVGFEF